MADSKLSITKNTTSEVVFKDGKVVESVSTTVERYESDTREYSYTVVLKMVDRGGKGTWASFDENGLEITKEYMDEVGSKIEEFLRTVREESNG